MAKIRNLTPGILHVPAAKLRLQGGAVADAPEITPDIQKQIDAGRLEVVTDEDAATEEAPALRPPDPPADYDRLDEAGAIDYIEDETDPKVIKSILNVENRPGVLDVLRTRLAETSDADQ